MPKRHLTDAYWSANHVLIRDHLRELTGLGPTGLQQLHNEEFTFSRAISVGDILRQRADGYFALEPFVLETLPDRYVDRFLADCLTLLDVEETYGIYYHPEFNINARTHGGLCEHVRINPLQHYSLDLRDAMADIRGNNIITNLGQAGCPDCTRLTVNAATDRLETDDTEALGYIGCPSQRDPTADALLYYESFDPTVMTTDELRELLTLTLQERNVGWKPAESFKIAVLNPTA
jgi:hypothetical protein